MKKYIFIISAVFLTLLSCDKDYNSIGSNIIGEGNYNFEKYEVQNINAYTKATGAVQSNNLPVNALGVFKDPFFGISTASFVTQLELASPNPSLGYEIELQSIDSVYLYVPYFSHLDPDNNATGNEPNLYILDSISGKLDNPFDLKIFESGYYLASNDVSEPTQGQKYYSDDKNLVENNLIGSQLNNSSDVNQNNTFKFSENEIIIYQTNDDGEKIDNNGDIITDSEDWIIKERIKPGMWIDLDKNFFKSKILETNSSNIFNNNNFKEYFRGLYFQVNPTNNDAAQAQLDFSDGYIILQFHSRGAERPTDLDPDVQNEYEETYPLVKKSITINLGGNNINFFENQKSTEYSNILSSSYTGEKIALKGQDGSGAFIEIFDQNELDNLRSKNWLINDAIFTVNVDNNFISELEQHVNQNITNYPNLKVEDILAKRIYLYDAINNTYFYDYYADTSTSVDNKLNRYNYGGILEKDATTGEYKYRIRITSYIRSLLSEDADEFASDLKLGLVVTENINTATYSTIKDNSIFGNDLVPVSSVMGPRGTVLYGTNVSASDIAKKMKLEIYYTEPK